MGMIWNTLLMWAFGVYMAFSTRELYRMFYPPSCKGQRCFTTRLPPGSNVDVHCFLVSEGAAAVPLWNITNSSADQEIEARFPVPVPPGLRKGEATDGLWLLFELRRSEPRGSETEADVLRTRPLAQTSINVVKQIAPRERGTAKFLLERSEPAASSSAVATSVDADDDDDGDDTSSASSSDVSDYLAPADSHGRRPHFIYGGRFLELRMVPDPTPHAFAYFPEGMSIGSEVDTRALRYSPHFYVEQFSLLRKHAHPLSNDLQKPHPYLRVKFKPISVGRHRMTAQVSQLFGLLEEQLGEALNMESDLDEIRELLSDERIYRFMLMQIIGLLHVLFDVLAFRSDIGFWKGRETMRYTCTTVALLIALACHACSRPAHRSDRSRRARSRRARSPALAPPQRPLLARRALLCRADDHCIPLPSRRRRGQSDHPRHLHGIDGAGAVEGRQGAHDHADGQAARSRRSRRSCRRRLRRLRRCRRRGRGRR